MFQFSEEGGVGFRFHADRKNVIEAWVNDLQSILSSQQQMKRGEGGREGGRERGREGGREGGV